MRFLLDSKYQTARIFLFAVVALVSFTYAQHAFQHPLWTFNLYYFSGAAERHGSFTDTAAVIALADQHHVTILHEGAFGAPSLVALFFQPISLLPLWLGHIVWDAIVLSALVLSLRKAVGKDWPIWGAILVLTPAVMLAWGVANAVLLTTPLLIYAYAALRDGQDKRAGVALALATALKLYPGFLILVLIATRRWVALKWTVGALAALGAITVAALGWNDAWTAARFTLHIGHNVYPSIQNVSLPGSLVQFFGSGPSQAVLAITTAGAVGVVIAVRRAPAHLAFAAGCTVMLLAQSMTWREYTMLAIVAAFAVRDAGITGTTRKVVAVGVVLCAGTSLSPYGLETGVNAVTAGLWAIVGDGSMQPAPSVTQTIGLALATGGLTYWLSAARTKIEAQRSASAHHSTPASNLD